jgi:hypothetical protein
MSFIQLARILYRANARHHRKAFFQPQVGCEPAKRDVSLMSVYPGRGILLTSTRSHRALHEHTNRPVTFPRADTSTPVWAVRQAWVRERLRC